MVTLRETVNLGLLLTTRTVRTLPAFAILLAKNYQSGHPASPLVVVLFWIGPRATHNVTLVP